MPIISSAIATIAPLATVGWELDYGLNNPFLPVGLPVAKPEPLSPGFAGVFLGVQNVRTSIRASGGSAGYQLLFDVKNLASIGIPIPYQVVVGFGN